jgi:hypothetical protein
MTLVSVSAVTQADRVNAVIVATRVAAVNRATAATQQLNNPLARSQITLMIQLI